MAPVTLPPLGAANGPKPDDPKPLHARFGAGDLSKPQAGGPHSSVSRSVGGLSTTSHGISTGPSGHFSSLLPGPLSSASAAHGGSKRFLDSRLESSLWSDHSQSMPSLRTHKMGAGHFQGSGHGALGTSREVALENFAHAVLEEK